MANTPHRKTAISVGTNAVQLYDDSNNPYSTPASTTDAITSILCCNKLGNVDIVIDCYITNGSNTWYRHKSLQILAGASEELMDSNSRPVLMPGDKIFFVSNTAASLDVHASFLNNS